MRSHARHLPHASIGRRFAAKVSLRFRTEVPSKVPYGFEAVHRLRHRARHGPLAHARGPREQQGRRQGLALDRPREERGQAAMADDVAEEHERNRS